MNLQPCSGLVALLRCLQAFQFVPPDLSTANRRPTLRLELNFSPAVQQVTGLFHLPLASRQQPEPRAVCLVPMDRPVSCRSFHFAFSVCRILTLRRWPCILQKLRFQLDWIRSSQLLLELALDRGRDQVRFPASPESCVSSLTCTSAPNLLRVPHARQAAHAFPVFNSSLRCCPCRYYSLA
jgi:hypothetical protein